MYISRPENLLLSCQYFRGKQQSSICFLLILCKLYDKADMGRFYRLSAMLSLVFAIFTTPAGAISYSIGTDSQATQQKLTPEKKTYILSRFCMEVKYNFAFLDRLTFNWDSICSARMPELVSTSSDEEFIAGMKSLSVVLKDGHTTILELNTL